MYKIMLVEDDERLRQMVKESLERYDFKVTAAEDFKNLENIFVQEAPDLILLDVNLPYYDGFYLCRIFRRKSKAPIIFISARSGDIEQVMGIELGADDYITKPFSIDLLVAKVKAALRRTYGEYAASDEKCLSIKGISLDEDSFKVYFKGNMAELSKNEFKLLKKLLQNKDKIVTREDLLSELWDDTSFVDDNTLTVNVTRVKSKLAEFGISDVIKTKRGLGYIFDSGALEGEDIE